MQVTGFAPDVTETIQELLPEVVVQYNDTIRLAARPQLGPIDTDVEISEISTDGVRIAANGESVWVDFASPVTGLDQLAQATVDLAEAARDLHPDEPMTSLEVIMTTARGQRLHRGTVIETRFLSDHLAAVRLGPFPGFESLGWDQSLSVLTMADGRPVPDDLTLESWRDMPEHESPRGRTYTVRSFGADGVMESWMALHGDDPESTSTWAQQCQPGDAVAVFGPRGRFTEPTGVDHAVLVADETAFGAAVAVAEGLDPALSTPMIGYDNAALAHAALTYLTSKGHSKIAVVHGPARSSDRISARVAGARKACDETMSVSFFETSLDATGGKQAVQTILDKGIDVTAILCLSDVLALGAYFGLAAASLSIPEDMSVMGFDNLDWSTEIVPPLTTTNLPARKMGRSVALQLMELLDMNRALEPTLLEGQIIERGSVLDI